MLLLKFFPAWAWTLAVGPDHQSTFTALTIVITAFLFFYFKGSGNLVTEDGPSESGEQSPNAPHKEALDKLLQNKVIRLIAVIYYLSFFISVLLDLVGK